ncbi:MAG: transposase [Peptococcaceae bacterium BRH_c23]|nr:MAG: transposase [Peptococcaceae bacterium BRH_c23]KJS88292.1 MAG: transposase [Desulfosporosinus sp. BICA1-9]
MLCNHIINNKPSITLKNGIFSIEVRLKELIREICEELQSELIELEIMPDHVHLLIEVDPQFGVHKVIKTIKGKSSRILRKEFKELTTKLPTLWTNSYLISTVGGAPLAIVKQYIESQKVSERR